MFKRSYLCIAIMILINSTGYLSNLEAEERDPFVSIIDFRKEKLLAQKSRVDLAKIVLKGIIWNDSRAVAIIDGELVMAGDDWKGFKIERIDKDSVTLKDQEESYKLFIKEELAQEEKVSLPNKVDLTIQNPELSSPVDLSPEEGENSYGMPRMPLVKSLERENEELTMDRMNNNDKR